MPRKTLWYRLLPLLLIAIFACVTYFIYWHNFCAKIGMWIMAICYMLIMGVRFWYLLRYESEVQKWKSLFLQR